MRAQGAQGEGSYRELNNILNVHAFMAMKDVQWSKYLHRPDHDAITAAYHKEWDALCSSVLCELHDGDSKFEAAKKLATKGRAILEFKRVGVWKVRVVICGHLEDRVRLDGPNYNYAANVCEFAAVRNLLFAPRQDPSKLSKKHGKGNDADIIASCDKAVAYTQADMFGPTEPHRYLKVKDPITGQWQYFRQLGNFYGSASAGKR